MQLIGYWPFPLTFRATLPSSTCAGTAFLLPSVPLPTVSMRPSHGLFHTIFSFSLFYKHILLFLASEQAPHCPTSSHSPFPLWGAPGKPGWASKTEVDILPRTLFPKPGWNILNVVYTMSGSWFTISGIKLLILLFKISSTNQGSQMQGPVFTRNMECTFVR